MHTSLLEGIRVQPTPRENLAPFQLVVMGIPYGDRTYWERFYWLGTSISTQLLSGHRSGDSASVGHQIPAVQAEFVTVESQRVTFRHRVHNTSECTFAAEQVNVLPWFEQIPQVVELDAWLRLRQTPDYR